MFFYHFKLIITYAMQRPLAAIGNDEQNPLQCIILDDLYTII